MLQMRISRSRGYTCEEYFTGKFLGPGYLDWGAYYKHNCLGDVYHCLTKRRLRNSQMYNANMTSIDFVSMENTNDMEVHLRYHRNLLAARLDVNGRWVEEIAKPWSADYNISFPNYSDAIAALGRDM